MTDGNFIAGNTKLQVPDYVFQTYFRGSSDLSPNYILPSLNEVKSFIQEHYHLPGVVSAEEVRAQGGIILNETTLLNLEKIEELFLYTLEQQEQIEKLTTDNYNLSKDLQDLKLRIAAMEELILTKNKN